MIERLSKGLELLAAAGAFSSPLVDASDQAAGLRAERLERYIAEIEFFNPAYGLVGAADRDELVTKHILDSLAPLPVLLRVLEERSGSGRPKIVDVGSGAGLPGIPLAIVLESLYVTLLERMGRRVGFLESATAALGLKNVAVEQLDAERAEGGRFDLVVFRAFRPLEPPMVKTLFRLLAPGGRLGAYKGRREKVAEEMGALAGLVGEWSDAAVSVPFLDEERRIVVIAPPSP